MRKGIFISKSKAPCYGCEERAEACHGRCEKFQAWSNEHNRQREERTNYHRLAGEADRRKREAVRKYFKREAKK